ncbi:MAG: phosphoribosylformylglycinamidine synthase subunit PurQ [Planctomycetes bacterium]|nr:phosphoribosylformylglycinamidine synthase subunit PurQ [Planctomycetota bacterium]MBU4400622.1 phosphoribosylformylglycinamidine synthase subunit PurQ [Planctomycetota bacterium]MCG2684411.1 phosphoribosylformylglycinamidine synthase subunit PurQ [Planctomycetales bacterium]
MTTPNVLILRAPGTNCDAETAFAFERVGAKTETLHVNRLLERPELFERFQILCIPGGFSYGDDLGAGRILGNQIQHHLSDQLVRFKADGNLILGICNGFQVLLKSPVLLEKIGADTPPATLTWNDSGRYYDGWVRLEVNGERLESQHSFPSEKTVSLLPVKRIKGSKSVFLAGIERMYLPVAHAEGKFVARDERTLQGLDAAGQLPLRYVAADNPNGSMAEVAGVCDSTGRVLGLMPHPERHIDPTQHPRWTRGEAGPEGAGLQMFRNAVKYFA